MAGSLSYSLSQHEISNTVEALPGTQTLEWQVDPADSMVAGIRRFLLRKLEESGELRERYWQRDYSSEDAYISSIRDNRKRFRTYIGAVDQRVPVRALHLIETTLKSSLIGKASGYTIRAVRWPVLEGVEAEGLWLEPEYAPFAQIIALPDADWAPEMLAGLNDTLPPEMHIARRLAEAGCRVLVPLLISRRDTWSGNPDIRMTNQPHREYVYRKAYEMGRHIIGYEVQKVLAAVDWFSKQGEVPIGITGDGEGGLIAFYSAALDDRIDGTLVSGYFQDRIGVWREPIYRNVWGLLTEFGDAEIAGMIAPRHLIIEASRGPEVNGPPEPRNGRRGAAPGRLTTPSLSSVRTEFERARTYFDNLEVPENISLIVSGDGSGPPGSREALEAFLLSLGISHLPDNMDTETPEDLRVPRNDDDRMRRQIRQLMDYTEHLVRESERTRAEFWNQADPLSIESWEKSIDWYRKYMWEEIIGRLPDPSLPVAPRTRLKYESSHWKGYEVALDVWPEVFAYGILLVPGDLQPGEQRPVVVCQHGLEGRPEQVVDPHIESPYHAFGAQLADRGYIVYAPQNPYIGGDRFRVLQRMANPLKKSLFSVIVGQHQQMLDWLKSLPFVNDNRIAFYGLSYGGKTAMRVPALLRDYCLSICSADFNEWVWKNTSTDFRASYMFTGEYEMYEFNLGNTFNYAEMAGLIAPRPFMVERGHHDGVAIDEWVAYEFAQVRRLYTRLGIPENTDIEYFDGPHEIHGVGTFQFLNEHLR
ncbi:MAG TPA: hypothetical protein VKA68_03925 [bacterium]|nr:hypothetical protein [bacterium]